MLVCNSNLTYMCGKNIHLLRSYYLSSNFYSIDLQVFEIFRFLLHISLIKVRENILYVYNKILMKLFWYISKQASNLHTHSFQQTHTRIFRYVGRKDPQNVNAYIQQTIIVHMTHRLDLGKVSTERFLLQLPRFALHTRQLDVRLIISTHLDITVK